MVQMLTCIKFIKVPGTRSSSSLVSPKSSMAKMQENNYFAYIILVSVLRITHLINYLTGKFYM